MNYPYPQPMFNPQMFNVPQQQRYQQPEQQYQQQQQPAAPTIKITNTGSKEEALSAQIPMDGTTTYFVFGNEILAKYFSFVSGKIETRLYVTETTEKVEEREDRLKNIENKLDELIKKSSAPSNSTKKKGEEQ